jgi:outer membrane protein W
MQKIIIVIIMITSVLNKNIAQIQKGSWIIDGDLHLEQNPVRINNYYRYKNDDSNADAEVGYFFTNRFAAGVQSGARFIDEMYFSRFTQSYDASSKRIFHITPYARYYFTPKSRFKTFYELSLEGSWNRSTLRDSYIDNRWNLNIRSKIGADFFLTNNIALEGSWAYLCYAGTTAGNSYSFPPLTFNPQFGIKFFLNTEKQDAKILAEKYLKKGNLTFGVTGLMKLGDYSYGSFIPYIGYFLTDKWMISSSLQLSAGLGYRFLSLVPELRYYHPITPSMQFMLRGAAAMGVFYNEQRTPTTQLGGQYIEAGIGLNQFVSENISIQATTNLHATGENYNNIYFKPNIKIGFQYFMSR